MWKASAFLYLYPCVEKLWDHFFNFLYAWGGKH